jgi:hypothetical protein
VSTPSEEALQPEFRYSHTHFTGMAGALNAWELANEGGEKAT